jgi:O-antigen ligase
MARYAMLIAFMLGSVFLLPMEVDSVFALILLLIWRDEQRRPPGFYSVANDPLFWVASSLLLYLGVSGIWSVEPSLRDFLQIWMRLVIGVCFILAIARAVIELEDFELYLSRVIVIAALVSAAICILVYYASEPTGHGRMYGLFRLNNAGKAGHLYAAALPFVIGGLLGDRGHWRSVTFAALIATVFAIALTGTRAAWLGGALGLLSYTVAIVKPKASFYVATMAAGCAVGLAFLAVAVKYPEPGIADLLLPRGDSYRLAIWSAHAQGIWNGQWLFGQGSLTQQALVPAQDMSFRGAHNMYLSVAERGGLLALALMLATMLWSAARCITRLDLPLARLALSLLLIGAVVFLFSGDRLIDKLGLVWFVLWLPAGIAIGLNATKTSR